MEDYASPLSVRLAGVHPTVRIAQTAGFPNGEADGEAWQQVARWSGFVPDYGDCPEENPCAAPVCPGDKILIAGHVRAVSRLLAETGPPENLVISTNGEGASASLPVKVSVIRCGFPGRTFIDSDRALVMDAGEIEVEIWAPSTWVVLPSPTSEFEADAPLHYANVQVTACPVRCCYPPHARLTYFAAVGSEQTLAQRSFVRPRRARVLQIATNVSLYVEFWSGNPVFGGVIVGSTSTTGGNISIPLDPFGAVTHVVIAGGVGATPEPILFTWEIG